MPAPARITKPFHYSELLARIGAVLMRMARARRGHELRYGDLLVNTLSREVTVAGVRVELSAKEYALLATLAPSLSGSLRRGNRAGGVGLPQPRPHADGRVDREGETPHSRFDLPARWAG